MATTYTANGAVFTGSTSANPTYPAGISVGDMCLLLVVSKLSSITPDTPSGYTLVYSGTGGTGVDGAATGLVRFTVFAMEAATAIASGTVLPVTQGAGTGDVLACNIIVHSKAAGDYWIVQATSGSDAVDDTTFSATGATVLSFTAGDRYVIVIGKSANVTTVHGAITATGATFGTGTELRDQGSTTGNDIAISTWVGAVNSGTATTAVTVPATLSASSYGVAGIVRLSSRTAHVLAGDAASTSTTTGAITATLTVAGAVVSTSTTTGDQAVSSPLTGSATSVSTTTGAQQQTMPLSGSAASTSTTTGALARQSTLTGTAASVSTTAGAITSRLALSGSATSSSATTGEFAGGALTLSGSAVSTSTTTGAQTARLAVGGSALSVSTTTGVQRLTAPLTGSATSTSSTTGTLSAARPLAGSALSASATSGYVTLGLSLAGSALSVSITAGALGLVPSVEPRDVTVTILGPYIDRTPIAAWIDRATITGPMANHIPITGPLE